MPHIFRIKATKHANHPQTGNSKSCQYCDKTPLKRHLSPVGRGEGGGGASGFTLTGALVSFDPRQETRSRPIGKRI